MPFSAHALKVLIASPSDVQDDRHAIVNVIEEWNHTHSFGLGVVLIPVRWETHSSPKLGERPQAIINEQIVDSSDMLIGTFRTKLGSSTGIAESGTVEEIERFCAAGKRVLLYFSKVGGDIDTIDPDQLVKLRDFKTRIRSKGLIDSYSSVEDFRAKLSRHLHQAVTEVLTHGVEGEPRKPIDVLKLLDQGNIWSIIPVVGEQIPAVVKAIYATPEAKIYATHIDYRPDDLARGDAYRNDWAKPLYTSKGIRVAFQRVVSVSCEEDADWIQRMMKESTNPNYVIRVLEGTHSTLPYPNMVISDSATLKKAFLSFRGPTSDGRGYFAFVTNNKVLIQGLVDHLGEFNNLPSAKEFLKGRRHV